MLVEKGIFAKLVCSLILKVYNVSRSHPGGRLILSSGRYTSCCSSGQDPFVWLKV